ncbi:hypothetical protein [Flavobacterium piscinae]|uniref:hypothetical protein n=1 Tax=Flavobacterium piscinae TaxID=2506424 RepID=UPI0013E9797C|nr:hypothetical protein [Flavobacterium piscinae]
MKKKFAFSIVFSNGEFNIGRTIKYETAIFALVITKKVIPTLSKFFVETCTNRKRIILEKTK